MNTVQLVGKIATDIRLQEFGTSASDSGKAKATFIIAVRRRSKNANAAPDWIRVETWGQQARNLVRYNSKGSRIAIHGRIRGEFYNRDGADRGGELRTAVVADEITYLTAPKQGEDSPAVAKAKPAR